MPGSQDSAWNHGEGFTQLSPHLEPLFVGAHNRSLLWPMQADVSDTRGDHLILHLTPEDR